jgi:nucleotide-binding universal stress UspA family protein
MADWSAGEDRRGECGAGLAGGVVLEGSRSGERFGPALVVGFDRRPESRAALEVALDLGRRMEAGVYVVHAVDISDYPVDPDAADWEEQARRILAMERDEVNAVFAGSGLSWSYRAWRDDPAHALICVADEVDALMIVVGSRGEGWRMLLDRLLSPSVSHRLINRAGRPVLVVSHTEAATSRSG